MNEIKGARYNITMRASLTYGEMEDMVSSFLSKEELTVMKKPKRHVTRKYKTNDLFNERDSARIRVRMSMVQAMKTVILLNLMRLLSAGAQDNLRADLLMEALWSIRD